MLNTLCDLQEWKTCELSKNPLLPLCRSAFTQANREMLRMGNLCLFLYVLACHATHCCQLYRET